MVQFDKYYKSCAVVRPTLDIMSKIGLTTNRDLSVPPCSRNTTSFIPPRYQESRGMSHYTTILTRFYQIK